MIICDQVQTWSLNSLYKVQNFHLQNLRTAMTVHAKGRKEFSIHSIVQSALQQNKMVELLNTVRPTNFKQSHFLGKCLERIGLCEY